MARIVAKLRLLPVGVIGVLATSACWRAAIVGVCINAHVTSAVVTGRGMKALYCMRHVNSVMAAWPRKRNRRSGMAVALACRAGHMLIPNGGHVMAPRQTSASSKTSYWPRMARMRWWRIKSSLSRSRLWRGIGVKMLLRRARYASISRCASCLRRACIAACFGVASGCKKAPRRHRSVLTCLSSRANSA